MKAEQFGVEMSTFNNHFMDIFGGDIVGKIKGAADDIRGDEDARHLNELYASDNFIQTATAGECLHIIKNLIERVSDIAGEAPELENAACSLEKHIAWEAANHE